MRCRQHVTWLVAGWLICTLSARAQEPLQLTLKEAVQRGLERNVGVLVAATRVEEAAASRTRQMARLLPQLTASALLNRQTVNLKAFGIDFPGMPAIVGPFSLVDFRLFLQQALLDLPNFFGLQASEQRQKAAQLSYQDARDFTILVVSTLYLHGQATGARVEAAKTRVATAQALYDLARDQKETGIATGVDVLRAQVQLAHERQRLLEAENELKRAKLALARTIGLDLATPLELAEPLEFTPLPVATLEEALTAALAHRPDYLALQAQRTAVEQERKAARSRYLPRLAVEAHYGAIGRTPAEARATHLLQGVVTLPLFDWDRRGHLQEADSRLQRLEHQLADMRAAVEQEVREARLNLESAEQQVDVARQGRELAQRELEMARDRFQAGVTNNIEVISAQDALARADENYILALTRHIEAKAALARALGTTEQIYQRYLGIQ